MASVRWSRVAVLVGVVLLCQWLWPSLVHEPLHLLALGLQGVSGTIHWDFGFPPHPSITRGELSSVAGALLFLTLPTLVSAALLAVVIVFRVRNVVVAGVATYLSFDAVVNIMTFVSSTSDFHFFAALVDGKLYSLLIAFVFSVAGLVVLWNTREVFSDE